MLIVFAVAKADALQHRFDGEGIGPPPVGRIPSQLSARIERHSGSAEISEVDVRLENQLLPDNLKIRSRASNG